MKQIFLLLIIDSVVLIPTLVFAECGFRKEPDQERLLTGPRQAYYGVQSSAHFDDGPGYNHYTGMLQLFDRSGKPMGEIRLRLDDAGDGADASKKQEIQITCPQVKSEFSESVQKRFAENCKNPFTAAHPKTDPKSILFALDQFAKTLELTSSKKNLCVGKYKVKIDPPISEYSEHAEGKLKWGRMQVTTFDQNLKTNLSVARSLLPPSSFWNGTFFDCLTVESEEAVIVRNYTYLFCEGEGEASFSFIPVSKKAIKSVQKNVEALRLIKKKKYKEAQTILVSAIELDSSNELTFYNLASVLALLDSKDKAIEINLKSFVDLSLKRAASNLFSKSKGPELETLLRDELKKKIEDDSDLKNVDRTSIKKLFN